MAAFAVSQVAAALGVRGAAAVRQQVGGGLGQLGSPSARGTGWSEPRRAAGAIRRGGTVGRGLSLGGRLRHGDLRATDRLLVAAVAAVQGIAMEATALRADLAQKLHIARGEQQEMQLLGRRLVEAQEAERRRRAREVHDGPLPSVLAMARVAEGPVAPAQLRQAALETADERVHPALQDDLGPAEAVKTYIELLSRVLGAHGPVVELEADVLPSLSERHLSGHRAWRHDGPPAAHLGLPPD